LIILIITAGLVLTIRLNSVRQAAWIVLREPVV
jgi:hypothetical protein